MRALDADQVLELRSLFAFFTEFDATQFIQPVQNEAATIQQLQFQQQNAHLGMKRSSTMRNSASLGGRSSTSMLPGAAGGLGGMGQRKASMARRMSSFIIPPSAAQLKLQAEAEAMQRAITEQEEAQRLARQRHYISSNALLHLLRALGLAQMTPEQCTQLIALHAHQSELGLSFDDFLCLYASVTRQLSGLSDELRLAWRLMDANHSGRVRLSVLRNVLIALHTSRSLDSETDEGLQAAKRIQRMLDDYFVSSAAAIAAARQQNRQLTPDEIDPQITYAQFAQFMNA